MRGTERILEMKRKRTQLMKARLAAIALGLVSIVLALTVFVLSKELKQAKNTINNYQKIEAELNIENIAMVTSKNLANGESLVTEVPIEIK